jgi:hypothetical protein
MSLSDAVYDRQVFDGGPPLRLQRSLGLVKPEQPCILRRALFSATIAWVPLALATAAQTLFRGDGSVNWFFSDFSIHARYLIALPALIFAERDCIPQLEKIVRHFVDIGLVTGSDIPRYRAAVDSTRRLLTSGYAELVVPLVSYLSTFLLVLYVPLEWVQPWQRTASGGFSPAGWWNLLVSMPLLLILLFGWVWRIVLWGRFLVLVAELNLRLLPSHPDSACGLRFVSTSLRGFRFINFALGAILAGAIADRVVYQGLDLLSFKAHLIGLIVFILIIFAGPLTVFIRKLRETKRRGMFEYGALATRLGHEFEAKWLSSESKEEMLSAPDFSATTDYFGVAANVYEVRELPFTLKDLIGPVIPALVPFLFVALLKVPFQVILDGILKIWF